MTARPHMPVTVAEFIAWGHRQEEKHEFVDGRILSYTVAFAGGTLGHADLVAGLLRRIRPHVRPCKTLSSDALVRAERTARYPDVVVTCDGRDSSAATSVYPKLIVEVLSDSTAAVDRGEKLDEYRAIESLEVYVLIDSREHWAETYRRSNGEWIASLPIVTGSPTFASIALDDLYAECGL